MAAQVVRSPDSEVPDLDNGLWERIRDAVAAESGADKSLWNGELHYTDPAEKIRGSASSDGTMRLNRKLVVEPLQEMYATRGQPATKEQWIARRNALKTAAHEFTHLTAPDHHDYDDRLSDMLQPEYKPLEEGVTEAWSQAALDDLADRVLLPDLAAEIKAVSGVRSYPGWEPASRSFADEVGAEVGEDGDEVLRRMANAPRTEKARAAADLMFDNSDLPDLVPAEEQEAVRQEIADEIDKGFADLQPLNQDTSVNRRSVSRQRGMEIADSAVDAVHAAEDRYRNTPEQQQQLQTGQEAAQESTRPQQDLSALPPPNPADRIPSHPEPQSQQQQQPNQQQPQGRQPQQVQDPRVAFAQESPAQQQARLQQAEAAQANRPTDPRVAFAQQSPGQQQERLRQGDGAQGNRPADPRGTSSPAQQPSAGTDRRGGSPAEDRDVAALRAVLDQQAPAAGAPRVPQGQATQGRRGGAQTGSEQSAGRSTEAPSR